MNFEIVSWDGPFIRLESGRSFHANRLWLFAFARWPWAKHEVLW